MGSKIASRRKKFQTAFQYEEVIKMNVIIPFTCKLELKEKFIFSARAKSLQEKKNCHKLTYLPSRNGEGIREFARHET